MQFGQDIVWADYYSPEVAPLLLLILLNTVILVMSWLYKHRQHSGNLGRRQRAPRILLVSSVALASLLFLVMTYHYATVVRPDVQRYYIEHPKGHYHHNMSFLDHAAGWIILASLIWGIPFLAMLNWKRGDALAQQGAAADGTSGRR